MKVGLAVIARATSSRLPRKHFQNIGDRRAIDVLLTRIMREFSFEMERGNVALSIVTGNRSENSEFSSIASGTPVFYGHDENIPLRLLQYCESEALEAVVCIDGDDILCSPNAVRVAYNLLREGIPRIVTKGLPLGMNASGVSRSGLESVRREIGHGKLETGWGRVFENLDSATVMYPSLTTESIRMMLDYPVDLEFFGAVVKGVPNLERINTFDLVRQIVEKRLHHINSYVDAEYWDNFHTLMAQEKAGK